MTQTSTIQKPQANRSLKTILMAIRSNRKTALSLTILALFSIIALTADVIAPYDPNEQNLQLAFQPPFWESEGSINYLLGTDGLGRDLLSRLIHGSRTAFKVALTAAILSAMTGIPLGLIGGYYRGFTDHAVTRLIDMWMSIPPTLLILVLISVLGVSINNLILAIAAVEWTRFARVIRSETLVIRERDYILAAKTSGLTSLNIIRKEVVPNIIPMVIIIFTLVMSIGVGVEVMLSFAGLGVKPSTPSWGNMISEGMGYLYYDVWPTLFPIVIVIIVVISINALGDGLRVILDPRLR